MEQAPLKEEHTSATTQKGRKATLPDWDQLVALAATALIVFLHVWFTPSVGGLWRDEVNTVNLATLPTWADLWSFHNQDSFPLLFAALVRVWSGFFGAGDQSLRILGLSIGLGLVAAFWINARLLGIRAPFWSLTLVGANPLVIRYGDSARAYGLGLLLLLLMFGLIWKVTRTRRIQWFVLAALASVLAVHALYYNAVLLFATCMGGCAVAWRQRDWRTAIAVLAVGAIAAVSMLPYLPTFLHANDWNFLVQYPFTLPWMWIRVKELIGSPHPIGIVAWVALLIAAVTAGGREIFRRRNQAESPPGQHHAIIFCAVGLLVGLVSYTGFLKLLNYYTQPWYYMALLAFLAACFDPILCPGRHGVHQAVRAGAVAVFLACTAVPASKIISLRHTNVDLVANALHSLAKPEDLVLIARWECGVTMNRYYKGPAAWTTIPPLRDFRFQAYQPVMEHMRSEDPLRPIMVRAEQTLRSGHKVWLVGDAPAPALDKEPPSLPRVVDPASGWRGSSEFYIVWVMQVTHFLRSHMAEGTVFTTDQLGPVSDYENLPVRSISGWK